MPFDPLPSAASLLAAIGPIEQQLAVLQAKLGAARTSGSSGGVTVTVNGLIEVVSVAIPDAAFPPATPAALAALTASLVAAANQAMTAAHTKSATDTGTAAAGMNLLGLCTPTGPLPNFAGFAEAAAALTAMKPVIDQRLAALRLEGRAGNVVAVGSGKLDVISLDLGELPRHKPVLESDVADAINRAHRRARDAVDDGIDDGAKGTGQDRITFAATCLYAVGRLQIDDRVKVKRPDGSFAPVVNAGGSLETNIGVEAQVGDVWSRAPVVLRNRAQVTGSVRSMGAISKASDATVTGDVRPHSLFQVPALDLRVTFPPNNKGDIDLQPQSSPLTIKPGAWASVSIKSNATLKISSGTYHFNSFTVEPQATISCDTRSGRIFIYVKGDFTHRGVFTDTRGGRPNLFIGCFTSNKALMDAPFAGTLVVPDGLLELATPPVGSPGHSGAFFGRNVTVRPDNTVTFFAYDGTPPLGS